MKKIKTIIMSAALTLCLGACSTPKLGYFQDVQPGQSFTVSAPNYVTLQPGDKVSILVSSKDPNLAYLFNLPIVGNYRNTSSDQTLSTGRIASYAVDKSGNIDFPILGEIHVAGLNRKEVASLVKNTLIQKELLKDPIVTVEFLDLTFGVLGEVKNPGRFNFDHDKMTLLDAISRAGDLTINGIRENVTVAREEGGKYTYYRVDLTNAASLYDSPVYYLKPNDIVYVEPNIKKAKEATELGNSLAQPSLWISVASLLTTITVLIVK